MGWCHKPGCHQELQVDSWVTVRLPLPLIGTQKGYNMLHLDIFGGLYNIYIYNPPCLFAYKTWHVVLQNAPLEVPSHKRKKKQIRTHIFMFGYFFCGQAFYKNPAVMYGW